MVCRFSYVIGLFVVISALNAGHAVAADDSSCLECHPEIDRSIRAVNKHEPALFGCLDCHTPHGEEGFAPGRVRMPVNDLCLGCHDGDKLFVKQGHVIDNHPLQGPRDPVYPDKPLTCASCHNPHGSVMEKLLRYDVRKDVTPYKGSICRVCHFNDWSRPPWNGN